MRGHPRGKGLKRAHLLKTKRPRIEFLSLGCDKNLVDTEKLLARLKLKGFEPSPFGEAGEILLINTCAFINPAKEESIEQILWAVERKKRGEIKKIVVVGCLVELYSRELEKEIPEVDLWVRYSELDQLEEKLRLKEREPSSQGQKFFPRFLTTPLHLSYLKISEGCDRGCTFCIIPEIRGRFRSVKEGELIAEAKFLEEAGVKELNLVAQDLTAYGKELGSNLVRLIEQLLKETRIPWLRLFYLNPEGISEELIELMRAESRICNYLDLPFQHISDRILKAMGRGTNEKMLRALLEKIRSQIPEVVLRGTALVGFPGEAEEDFEKLRDFVEEVGFDWLGVFAFSPEAQAPASRFPEQVPEGIARARKEELELLWQELAERKIQGKIGKVLEVLVDGGSDQGFDFQGRSQFEAYELDGVIHLKGDFEQGKFYSVRVINSLGLDLIAKNY